jgi:probable rRNA maturation factor
MIEADVANLQTSLAIDEGRIRQAVACVLHEEGMTAGSVSVAIVHDDHIRDLHRKYLGLDSPTDVLSFLLEQNGSCLDGQIVASADTALRTARELGERPEDEILLYVIHGALHLAGYDDQSAEDRQEMREREKLHLARHLHCGAFEPGSLPPSLPGRNTP